MSHENFPQVLARSIMQESKKKKSLLQWFIDNANSQEQSE